jgi:hypothetical protein
MINNTDIIENLFGGRERRDGMQIKHYRYAGVEEDGIKTCYTSEIDGDSPLIRRISSNGKTIEEADKKLISIIKDTKCELQEFLSSLT